MNSNELRGLFYKKRDEMVPLFSDITSKLSEGISLYGYGFVGKWAFGFLNRLDADVRFIVDNDKDKQGTFVNSVPILSNDQADFSEVSGVIIGSRHAAKTIARAFEDLAIPVISIDAFIACYYSPMYLERLEELMMHDSKSLEVLYSVLLAMLTGENAFLQGNISYGSLFSEYPFYNVMTEVFLDAGAYVGDTFERFIWSVNGMFKHAYLFEPGRRQFDSMILRVSRLCNEWCIKPNQIQCENAAFGSMSGQSQFYEATIPTQSQDLLNIKDNAIDQSQIISVKKVSLDSYFQKATHVPSLIKVDIEGSETEFLDGGKNLISHMMPKIALSIYHYPSDIFLLPIKLATMAPSYTFSMRHHSCMLMETILYCYKP